MASRVYPRTLKSGGTVWDAVLHLPTPSGGRKQVQKTFKKQTDAKRWVLEQQQSVKCSIARLDFGGKDEAQKAPQEEDQP
jgi:hypothetical protein